MNEPNEQPPHRITETEVRRLIARAIELDRQYAEGLTLDQLRQVAADAGISGEAVEAAIRESQQPYASAAVEGHVGRPSLWRPDTLLRNVIVIGVVLLALLALLEL
jgi:hypothetical protein